MKAAPALNPANGVTLLRLVLAPVFAVWLLDGREDLAFWAFVVAASSDLLDGWLARRFGWVTALGVFIDPLADKALQLTAFTVLSVQHRCPLWLTVLVWTRELFVVCGFALMALVARLRSPRSSWYGKAGTLAQMACLGTLLATQAFRWGAPYEAKVVLALAAAVLFNFMAGMEYIARGFQAYESRTRGPQG